MSTTDSNPVVSDSSLPNLKAINSGAIVAGSKKTSGGQMVAFPRSLASRVYCLMVVESPGENIFSLIEADLEFSSTIDTYNINVGLNKITRTTFVPQLATRNTVTASTNTEEVNTVKRTLEKFLMFPTL